MFRFDANLSYLFTELPPLDRFAAAADAGFTAAEYLFPYRDLTPDQLAKGFGANLLTPVLLNMPPGDYAKGERGFAALPDRFDAFQASVRTALDYANAAGVKRLHMMSGIADRRDPANVASFRKSVAWAAEALGRHGIDLLLEPLNGRDMPGYFLGDYDFAEAEIKALNLSNVRLQFDTYHRQILHGDVITALRRELPMIGHIQVSSVPSRNEPDDEELNHKYFFRELERLGYDGFVGCEYRPRGKTLDGLGWFAPYRHQRA